MGSMQTPMNLSQRLLNGLARFMNRVGILVQQLLLALVRLWRWLNDRDWPQLPLTPFQWIALFYVVLALIFVVVTPPLEAGRELQQFALVQHVEQTGQLPEASPDSPGLWREEAVQPPLYTYAAAAITSLIDTGDFNELLTFNPHLSLLPSTIGNKNLLLRDTPFLPLEGAVLAVMVLRLLGVGLGLVTVWAVYRIGQHIAPQRPIAGYVAAAVTAFNPMFLFVSASVNPLTLTMVLNSLAISLMLVILRDGFQLRRCLLLAVLLALGTLAHLSAWVLIVLTLFAGLWAARRDKAWPGLGVLAGAIVVGVLIVSGWWYARNLSLYDDLTALSVVAQYLPQRPEGMTVASLLVDFQTFRTSYWGLFGIQNLTTGFVFYSLVDFFVFLSLFGVLFLVMQLVAIRDFGYARRELVAVLLILAIVLLGLIGYFLWTMRVDVIEGRLMFPYIGATSAMIAVGLVEIVWWFVFLLSPPERSFVRAGEAVPEAVLNQSLKWPLRLLGIMTVLVPLTTILPAYAPPATQDEPPDRMRGAYADYGIVELIGYNLADRRYVPRENVDVTLYWRVKEQTESDTMVALGLVDPQGRVVGKLDSIPGSGTLRTTAWQPGKIYADRYSVPLSAGSVDDGYVLRLDVNWWDRAQQVRLPAVDDDGDLIPSVLLAAGVVVSPEDPVTAGFIALNDRLAGPAGADDLGTATPEPQEVQSEFGGVLRLAQFRLENAEGERFGAVETTPEEEGDQPETEGGETDPVPAGTGPQRLQLRILWEATAPPDENYTAFMHLLNPEGEIVVQADVMPDVPTSYWFFQDRYIVDYPFVLPVDLQPGAYEIHVGWYDLTEEGPERLLLPPDVDVVDSDDPEAEPPQADSFRLFNLVIDAEGNVTTPELPEPQEETEEADGTLTPELESDTTPTATAGS